MELCRLCRMKSEKLISIRINGEPESSDVTCNIKEMLKIFRNLEVSIATKIWSWFTASRRI